MRNFMCFGLAVLFLSGCLSKLENTAEATKKAVEQSDEHLRGVGDKQGIAYWILLMDDQKASPQLRNGAALQVMWSVPEKEAFIPFGATRPLTFWMAENNIP